jgi:NAD(P)-dependent dehydrogenase (short-subunit alcohol dehydrogenase family)
MLFSLKDRVAIVTGAGSRRGIGRAIALALAEQGADVVVCDLDLDGAKDTASEVAKKGVRSEAYKVNVTCEEEVNNFVKTVLDKFGKIDILVNNAGITQPVKVAGTTGADWDRVLSVNLKSTFLFSKAVAPSMIERKYGRIVSMSSVSGKRGGGVYGGAHYSAAKAGILGFSKAFAREVSPMGITVNSIAPGSIATDIRPGLIEDVQLQQEISLSIPCGRLGKPEEVAATVCFLASEEAGYITGEDIDINGGSHMD